MKMHVVAFTQFNGWTFKSKKGGQNSPPFLYFNGVLHMEHLDRNKKIFNKEMGTAFRIFRVKVLKKTLKDIGGQTLIPSLSNFETGKLFRYSYMYYYIMACEDEHQVQLLENIISQVIINAWKRG